MNGQRMTTDELICALREWADQMAMPGRRRLVQEAADRLEEMDERIAIMEEGRGEGTSSVACGDTFPSRGRLVDDYDEHRHSGLLSED